MAMLEPCDEIGAGCQEQFFTEPCSKFDTLIRIPCDLVLMDFGTIGRQDLSEQSQLVAVKRGQSGDRGSARAVEHFEESPLRLDALAGLGIVKHFDEPVGGPIVGAGFDHDCALGRRGREMGDIERMGYPVGLVEPVQPGHGQQRRIGHPIGKFLQARLHISAKFHCAEVRTKPFHLGATTQGRRTDHGAFGQMIGAFGDQRQEGIAHILARQICGQGKHGVDLGRHVLCRMHCDIDLAIGQRRLDFFCEQPLAANFGQWAVQDDVAAGLDDLDGDGVSGQPVYGGQPVADLLGLSYSKGGTACADGENGGGRQRLQYGLAGVTDVRVFLKRGESGLRSAFAIRPHPFARDQIAAMDRDIFLLGIETSCDETAAAIVRRDVDGHGDIVSNIVRSQIEEHKAFGGVVPELAARAHVVHLDTIISRALDDAGMGLADIDAIAATAGPGLIGGVLVGLTTGKALAAATGKPLIAVNHLEGHALTARLTDRVEFPYLMLLVSGGHSQIVLVKGVGDYERWGSTIDDALGEAFDKAAKLLGLGYPGGPEVEKAARNGDPKRFALPRPLLREKRLDFSFSGLKTALRLAAESVAPVSKTDIADLCASFQAAVTDIVAVRSAQALARFAAEYEDVVPTYVVAGGVAANAAIGSALREVARQTGANLVIPPPALCTDNGAMIGWAGAERFALGLVDGFDVAARPRWPLDELARGVL